MITALFVLFIWKKIKTISFHFLAFVRLAIWSLKFPPDIKGSTSRGFRVPSTSSRVTPRSRITLSWASSTMMEHSFRKFFVSFSDGKSCPNHDSKIKKSIGCVVKIFTRVPYEILYLKCVSLFHLSDFWLPHGSQLERRLCLSQINGRHKPLRNFRLQVAREQSADSVG